MAIVSDEKWQDDALAFTAKGFRATARFDLVGTVGDGAALIDAARKLRPDVIIADMAMPVLSGWRLCAASRPPRAMPKLSS
jgi:CheY-like chemotaxis protein